MMSGSTIESLAGLLKDPEVSQAERLKAVKSLVARRDEGSVFLVIQEACSLEHNGDILKILVRSLGYNTPMA